MVVPSGEQPRVLVVEDEPQMRVLYPLLLRRSAEVVTVENGDEAVALLQRDRRFDAVVCDIVTPGRNGYEVYRWLQRHIPALARRTIFVTGGDAPEIEDRLHNRPVYRKPLTKMQLHHAVQKALTRPSTLVGMPAIVAPEGANESR